MNDEDKARVLELIEIAQGSELDEDEKDELAYLRWKVRREKQMAKDLARLRNEATVYKVTFDASPGERNCFYTPDLAIAQKWGATLEATVDKGDGRTIADKVELDTIDGVLSDMVYWIVAA